MLKVANSVINASRITGVLPVANGGTNASTASITSFNNITGFTASGTTGTTSTNLVFATTPTLVGNVTLSTGNLVIGTAGKGIDFSIDPSAAGMTSELLNDYEQGTWTPVVSSAGGTVTGANQGSSYAKVGGLVVAIGYINVSSVSLPTGALTISGLPFTSSAQYFPVTFTLFGGGFTTSQNGYGGASATTFVTTNVNASVMIGGENIMFTAIYRV